MRYINVSSRISLLVFQISISQKVKWSKVILYFTNVKRTVLGLWCSVKWYFVVVNSWETCDYVTTATRRRTWRHRGFPAWRHSGRGQRGGGGVCLVANDAAHRGRVAETGHVATETPSSWRRQRIQASSSSSWAAAAAVFRRLEIDVLTVWWRHWNVCPTAA